jgi:hypothetical protein
MGKSVMCVTCVNSSSGIARACAPNLPPKATSPVEAMKERRAANSPE